MSKLLALNVGELSVSNIFIERTAFWQMMKMGYLMDVPLTPCAMFWYRRACYVWISKGC
jgi:hypothetical protein